MRSHPYTPPPPLPPILDELAEELSAVLPNQGPPRRRGSDPGIELGELDPDTSRLVPTRRKRHSVWVQGKLVVVRKVSAMAPKNRPGTRYESAVGSAAPQRRARRRRSLDDGASPGSDSETEEDERETVRRDRQLRGYGIGGAGNIRRPTEVVHFPTRRTSPLLLSPTSPADPEKRRWNIREMFGLAGDRKGKDKAHP